MFSELPEIFRSVLFICPSRKIALFQSVSLLSSYGNTKLGSFAPYPSSPGIKLRPSLQYSFHRATSPSSGISLTSSNEV